MTENSQDLHVADHQQERMWLKETVNFYQPFISMLPYFSVCSYNLFISKLPEDTSLQWCHKEIPVKLGFFFLNYVFNIEAYTRADTLQMRSLQ